ncbi:hypothetical protein PFISCL1PPCAC_17848, partial [Pristionchus fissidentatus]
FVNVPWNPVNNQHPAPRTQSNSRRNTASSYRRRNPPVNKVDPRDERIKQLEKELAEVRISNANSIARLRAAHEEEKQQWNRGELQRRDDAITQLRITHEQEKQYQTLREQQRVRRHEGEVTRLTREAEQQRVVAEQANRQLIDLVARNSASDLERERQVTESRRRMEAQNVQIDRQQQELTQINARSEVMKQEIEE